jgi:glycosyltransferase involved in cell wall biosynthesis
MNEEETISACIASVIQSAASASNVAALWIVVVADSCSDRTVVRAQAILGNCGEVLECGVRSPGVARQLGVAVALNRLGEVDPGRVWIANTDADSYVPPDWLIQHLLMAEQGVAALAGIVRVHEVPGHGAALASRLLSDYEVHADGTHPHVHGANLGVRADAYLDAGGWSARALAEDHCLWRRIRLRGWPLMSSSQSVVVTSGRLVGRALGGFADTLRSKAVCLHG